MAYENPSNFIDTEKEKTKKQKRWCIKKALKLADIKSTEEKPSEMTSEEIVQAAENFEKFLEDEN